MRAASAYIGKWRPPKKQEKQRQRRCSKAASFARFWQSLSTLGPWPKNVPSSSDLANRLINARLCRKTEDPESVATCRRGFSPTMPRFGAPVIDGCVISDVRWCLRGALFQRSRVCSSTSAQLKPGVPDNFLCAPITRKRSENCCSRGAASLLACLRTPDPWHARAPPLRRVL